MSKIQRVTGTTLASVALVSLAACGGSSSSKSAASSGKAAATSGATAAKSSSTSSASESGSSSSDAKTLTGQELADKQKAATGTDYAADMTTTTTTPKISFTSTGVTSIKGGKTPLKMTVNIAGKTMQEVLVDGVMYVQMNGQWYKMDGTSGEEGGLSKMLKQSSAGQLTDQAKNQQWRVVSSDSNGTTYETTLQAGAINSAASSMSVSASVSGAEKITEQTDSKGRLTKATMEIPGGSKVVYTVSNYRAPETISAPANAKSFSSMGR